MYTDLESLNAMTYFNPKKTTIHNQSGPKIVSAFKNNTGN
jgi:hypothetical protein